MLFIAMEYEIISKPNSMPLLWSFSVGGALTISYVETLPKFHFHIVVKLVQLLMLPSFILAFKLVLFLCWPFKCL